MPSCEGCGFQWSLGYNCSMGTPLMGGHLVWDLALLCHSSRLPVSRSVSRVVNSLLFRSKVSGNRQGSIGLHIDQLVAASQQGLFFSFSCACLFCHLEESWRAFFPSWEGTLYFSAPLLLLGWCTGYGGTQRLPIMIPVPSQDRVCCPCALCVTWQDVHVLCYYTYHKQGEEQCTA